MRYAEIVDAAIRAGDLPSPLVGADPERYRGITHAPTWTGWCDAWRGIAYVRLQAFERWYDAAACADDWSDP
jgi:hypothetical protein